MEEYKKLNVKVKRGDRVVYVGGDDKNVPVLGAPCTVIGLRAEILVDVCDDSDYAYLSVPLDDFFKLKMNQNVFVFDTHGKEYLNIEQ